MYQENGVVYISANGDPTAIFSICGVAFRLLHRIDFLNEMGIRVSIILMPVYRGAWTRRHARPILDGLRSWLDETLPQLSPTSAAGKALKYLHREWQKLIHYLEDDRLAIDNNGARNAMRGTRALHDLFKLSLKVFKIACFPA